MQHKKDNEFLLKDLIGNFVNEQKLTPKLLESTIITNWQKIVGDLIAKNTDKIYVREGVLYLYIQSAALRQELSYQKQKIADLVNEHLNQNFIEQVVVR
ncbi:MAG: DUF721 domain-containing protein [Bacteroidia bacterium]